MKKTIISLTFVLTSQAAFSGGYSFDCSNQDGSILISNKGQTVKMDDKDYSSTVGLKGLEIWDDKDDTAELIIKSKGKRVIFYEVKTNKCRDITQLNFAQEFILVNTKTKKIIANDYFICENASATTMGGVNNPECAQGEN